MLLSVDEIEPVLIRIWAEVLERDSVLPADDFFEISGDSLTAVLMCALVEERMGIQINLQDVLDAPQLAALASRLVAKCGGVA